MWEKQVVGEMWEKQVFLGIRIVTIALTWWYHWISTKCIRLSGGNTYKEYYLYIERIVWDKSIRIVLRIFLQSGYV